MLSRTKGSTTTSYLYENAAWGDLLTSYKGQKLAYEGQTYVSSTSVTGTPKSGNPISYYNGTRWTMGWQGANQLISASSSGKSLSFTYDVNGLRTSKTYNGTKYQYAYAGDRLLWQGWSGNEMFFFYDEQGAPFAFRHVSSSGTVTIGYYLLNGQGDVVQIENASGTVLASYAYDPWGKHLTLTGTFATINPLRYRGYYYDTETGFYYLQNRYYDPAISRFINADSYAATGGLLGYNMFAYCENNPVNCVDPSGKASIYDYLGGGGGSYGSGGSSGSAAGGIGPITAILLSLPAIAAALAPLFSGPSLGDVITPYIQDSISVEAKDTPVSDATKQSLTSAADKTRTKISKERKRTDYWIAARMDFGEVEGVIPIHPISYTDAIPYVRKGGSVFARSRPCARRLALAVGYGAPAKKSDRHQSLPGYYKHYHAYNHQGGHIFYGSGF